MAYDAPAGQDAAMARQLLKVGGTDGLAKGFTKTFKLPVDLKVHAVNGLVGPNYYPETKH